MAENKCSLMIIVVREKEKGMHSGAKNKVFKIAHKRLTKKNSNIDEQLSIKWQCSLKRKPCQKCAIWLKSGHKREQLLLISVGVLSTSARRSLRN